MGAYLVTTINRSTISRLSTGQLLGTHFWLNSIVGYRTYRPKATITGLRYVRTSLSFVDSLSLLVHAPHPHRCVDVANAQQRRGLIIRVGKMETHDLNSMSVDQLWSLHLAVAAVLARNLLAEKTQLEGRLRELGQSVTSHKRSRARRPYPQVFPKFRNPSQPSETWAGRGKQPRWLTAQLRSGKKLDDFRIQPQPSADRSRRRTG